MELKIRIKEVKEETRDLTTEEECMFRILLDGINYDKEFRQKVNSAFSKTDCINAKIVDNICIGDFKHVDIRDATPEEIMAWHILQSVNTCDLLTCEECFCSGSVCICDMMIYDDSYELLKNKEVILELV